MAKPQKAKGGAGVEIRPYAWEGPYAEMRTAAGAKHDPGLCADVRAPWMEGSDRIILRSSEIVGYETGYLYDDHLPTHDPQGRGKDYKHVSFQWNIGRTPETLSADCVVPGKGKFWLRLRAQQDFIHIELGIRNDLGQMGNIDWHFCVVGYDSPSIGDAELARTYLFCGQRLRTLREMSGAAKCEIYKVAGAKGFLPAIHKALPRGPVEAQASVVIVESVDGKHTVALGFEQSYSIFSNPANKCFHADPYFGPFEKKGEERIARGKLHLIEGTAQDAFKRYIQKFGATQTSLVHP